MVKEFLSRKGVAYEEKDVSTDQAAALEMIRRTRQQAVPVTEIDGEIVIGFDRPRLEQLLAAKVTQRPSFGLKIADASKIAVQQGAVPLFGAYVGGVRPGSAAEQAGFQAGDIVVEVNMQPIRNAEDLARVLLGLTQGSRAEILFLRGGQQLRVETVYR